MIGLSRHPEEWIWDYSWWLSPDVAEYRLKAQRMISEGNLVTVFFLIFSYFYFGLLGLAQVSFHISHLLLFVPVAVTMSLSCPTQCCAHCHSAVRNRSCLFVLSHRPRLLILPTNHYWWQQSLHPWHLNMLSVEAEQGQGWLVLWWETVIDIGLKKNRYKSLLWFSPN